MNVMVRTPSNTDSAFSEYVARLVELHELMSAGQDESEAAEAIRDRMDAPWQRLSAEQVALVDGLSADLYSLEEPRSAPPDLSADADEFATFERSIHENDWPAALDVVRRNENRLEPNVVLYLRGTCWAHLGQPAVAILFLEAANRLQPLDPEGECWLLGCMIQAGRAKDALPRAREIARTESTPMSLLPAADVIFAAATTLSGDAADALYREAVELAERGLAAADTESTTALLDVLRVNSLLHIALTHDRFGNRRSAIETCKRALQIDPERETALELLGFLSFNDFPVARREVYRHRFQEGLAFKSASNATVPMIELN